MSEEIMNVLNRISQDLIGRKISEDEKMMLMKKFDVELMSLKIIDILSNYKIVGQIFSISEEKDSSGIGVNMEWLTPYEQIQEAYEYYPGLLAVKKGYLPIGMCLEGSGDPYFLKEDNQRYILVRIPHDAIYDEVLDDDSIEYICELSELFNNVANS